jgi:peptidoglycan/xylan/chitin deacetylase (PgdA/CDA1 family)
VLIGSGALVWTAPNWLVDLLGSWYPGCVYRIPVRDRLLALTFDDGPDPASTPLIITELRKYRGRATFFLITEKLPNQEHLVRTLVAEGHELGNHFTRDRPSLRLSPEEFERDLVDAHGALARFDRVSWARPGSGWYSRSMVSVMRWYGYRCALGSVYPFDASIPSVGWANRYILRNARPGAIVILHDGGARGRRTVRVLQRVLPQLQRRGYRMVSLSELEAASTQSTQSSPPRIR